MRGSNCLYVIFLLGLLTACTGKKTARNEEQTASLLPVPVTMQPAQGNFNVSADTKIAVRESNKELHSLAIYLSSELQQLDDLQREITDDKDTSLANHIQLSIDAGLSDTVANGLSTDAEGYVLDIRPDRIHIRGKSAAAVFYGIQTLLQLTNRTAEDNTLTIPAIQINDYPAYAWRGMHLDVCRHFFPVAFIKKMIDVMAMHKLNTFHWHLTDDQGWRIEIKKYPLLTAVGGWRKETVMGHMSSHPLKFDGKKYGGFYTQEQIKDVVAYAKSKYITIVPEIEMPGHAMAALAAYPEYSCTGGPFEVFTEWGETKEAFCGGKEKTFEFIEDVLAEVITLFPGNYIHVGGDECAKERWKQCNDCRKRMKDEQLKNEVEMQSYFIERIENYLASKGKKLIGWDEILDGGLPERSTVMSWRGTEGGIAASNSGHDVVMTPGKYCYLDHYQGNPETEPLAIGGYLPLDSVYRYDPSQGLDAAKRKHVLGAQANLWTEYIQDEAQVEYMLVPRLCAMAEVLWSPKEKKNYTDFIQRMDRNYQRLDQKHIQYRIDVPVGFNDVNKVLEDTVSVDLHVDIPSAEIRYTLDGSTPEKTSALYTKPFQLPLNTSKKVTAKTFMPNGRASAALTGTFEKTTLLPGLKVGEPKPGLLYNYYNSAFSSAREVLGKPTKSGIADSIGFPKWIHPKQEWFAMEYKGYLKIDQKGLYTFYVNADDGAVLYIDDVLVVDNDGYHYLQEKSGSIGLGEGYHSLRLAYFEGKYTPVLEVKIMCQGLKKQAFPSNMLWHE
jgi:hexosaminidase